MVGLWCISGAWARGRGSSLGCPRRGQGVASSCPPSLLCLSLSSGSSEPFPPAPLPHAFSEVSTEGLAAPSGLEWSVLEGTIH